MAEKRDDGLYPVTRIDGHVMIAIVIDDQMYMGTDGAPVPETEIARLGGKVGDQCGIIPQEALDILGIVYVD